MYSHRGCLPLFLTFGAMAACGNSTSSPNPNVHPDAALPSMDSKDRHPATMDTLVPDAERPAAHDTALDTPSDVSAAPSQAQLVNPTAYLPAQCYTQTQPTTGPNTNTCYTCHRTGTAPNFVDDSQLQLGYIMPARARANPWTNLFQDRQAAAAAIDDKTMHDYVQADNYPALAKSLAKPPAAWDYDGDGVFAGFIPDAAFQFDDRGYDKTSAGVYTGWRAFAYFPFPGTHWPTNGSADDVLIRLAEPFRKNAAGVEDLGVYTVNLAVVEALIARKDVPIDPVDEQPLGVDLDKDGTLGTATKVAYAFAPLQGRTMSFVGQAKAAQDKSEVHLAAGLFPEGTEFMQTLRYLEAAPDGTVSMAPRMKEVRYARKTAWRNYSDLQNIALRETKDRHDFPDETRLFTGDHEHGVRNLDSGWVLQGFIEDRTGALRPQSFEETTYCLGCHGGGIGATTDSMFAFARKLGGENHRRGWYHWTQKELAGLNEPKIGLANAGVFYEYSYYLMYTRSGDEYLANVELHDTFFSADGSPKEDRFAALHDDISIALLPSASRAMALNKAYRTIVLDQSYAAGRDVLLAPAARVWRDIPEDATTGVEQIASITAFAGCIGSPCVSDATTPVPSAFERSVIGGGMEGPDGDRYEVDWQGLIHRSRYAATVPGVTFTFPRRLTPPAREIVALGPTSSCYTCHRVYAPIVDTERKTTISPGMPPVSTPPMETAAITQLTTHVAHDTGARPSPDGKTIAFVSDRTGLDQVWLMDADGQNQRALTQGLAKHAWPEWHPDGTRLVVWSHDNGQHAIRIIPVDGSTATTLVSRVEAIDRPVFHPDGKTIAYGAVQGSNWDVWIIGVDGIGTRRLTSDDAMESNPLWSPDGKSLAYKVAPSGRYGLTIENFLTFEKGLEVPTLHTWNGPQAIQMSAWSPDGKAVAYTAETISGASGADRVSYAVVVSTVDLAGTEAVATTSTILSQGKTLGDRGATFSPDGKHVAFWAWDPNHRATLWLYNRAMQTVRPLTTQGSDMVPAWCPDGSCLIFESNRSGNTDLWRIAIQP